MVRPLPFVRIILGDLDYLLALFRCRQNAYTIPHHFHSWKRSLPTHWQISCLQTPNYDLHNFGVCRDTVPLEFTKASRHILIQVYNILNCTCYCQGYWWCSHTHPNFALGHRKHWQSRCFERWVAGGRRHELGICSIGWWATLLYFAGEEVCELYVGRLCAFRTQVLTIKYWFISGNPAKRKLRSKSMLFFGSLGLFWLFSDCWARSNFFASLPQPLSRLALGGALPNACIMGQGEGVKRCNPWRTAVEAVEVFFPQLFSVRVPISLQVLSPGIRSISYKGHGNLFASELRGF